MAMPGILLHVRVGFIKFLSKYLTSRGVKWAGPARQPARAWLGSGTAQVISGPDPARVRLPLGPDPGPLLAAHGPCGPCQASAAQAGPPLSHPRSHRIHLSRTREPGPGCCIFYQAGRARPACWPALPGPCTARHSLVDTPTNI